MISSAQSYSRSLIDMRIESTFQLDPFFFSLPVFGPVNTALAARLPYPTDLFTALELQNPSYNVSELHKIRQYPDSEALEK